MDLLQLKYFQTVARLEHMTNAARELHIAQPALSMTIARLEEDLGVPLFDRVGRQIRINTFGKAFLKHVDEALGTLEEGRREMEDLTGLERGSILLASTSLHRAADLLGPFLSMYPDVNFRITQAITEEETFDLLEKGEIDFCLATSAIQRAGVCNMPLQTEEIVLAVPASHHLSERQSIRLSEVADDPFINLKSGYSFRKITDEFCSKAGFKPNIVCEGDEPAAISSLVRAGLGVAFLPAAAKREMPPLHLLHIEEPVCQWKSHLVWLENHYLSLAAQAFRQYIMEQYAVKQP